MAIDFKTGLPVAITKMNGKKLIYSGMADFNDPLKAIPTGRHTTLEAWDARMKRASRKEAIYGWVWVEYTEERLETIPPIVSKPRLVELVLKSQEAWQFARRVAMRERPILSPVIGHADCCLKMVHCIEDHVKTTRHFRYWALQWPELALRTWPWLKELIAEDVLCQSR